MKIEESAEVDMPSYRPVRARRPSRIGLRLPMRPQYVPIDEYTFPPNQRKVVDLVKNIAKEYNYVVEIVDITKENILEKLIEEIKGLDIIPTVKTSLGGRLEGSQITKENVELLLLNETRQRPIG